MRGVKRFRNLGLYLSHSGYTNSNTFHRLPHISCLNTAAKGRPSPSVMGSTGKDFGLWPAKRVRDTFLEFFSENGHVFGELV